MMIEPTSKDENVVRGTDIGKGASQFDDLLKDTRAKVESPDVQEFVEDAVGGGDAQSASVNAFEGFKTIANEILVVGISGKGQ